MSYATLVNGPEDGLRVFVGNLARPPRKIDFAGDGDRIARYVRCTRLDVDPGRPRGCGHVGRLTYRFKGYVEEAVS